MPRAEAGPEGGLVRALFISALAAAVPIAGAFLFPDSLQDYEALTWLLLLVPAFLWAYERGWGGVATALAAGMAILSVTYATAEIAGRTMPDLMLAVVVVYAAISLAIGLFRDRVGKATMDAATESLALRDPLTNLPNRRYAEHFLDIQFAAAERGGSLAVVLFEMDDLEAVIRRSGPEAGDDVLRGCADLLRRFTRRMDLSARYGPESFVAVLTGGNEEGAFVFASRFLEQWLARVGADAEPTVSAGVASYHAAMSSPQEFLHAAEQALRAAKDAGGDRVRIHGRTPDADAERAMAARRGDAVAGTGADDDAGAAPPAGAADDPAAAAAGRSRFAGRTAFVMTRNKAAAAHVTGALEARGFRVMEGRVLPDLVTASAREFDLAFIDLMQGDTTAPDMVRHIRNRSPATRIVGIPLTQDGSTAASVLELRVDAHFTRIGDDGALLRLVADLLTERDTARAAELRQREMSQEMRAMDREAKQAVAAGEQYFRSLIEQSGDLIVVLNADGSIRYISPAVQRVFGYAQDDLIGRDPLDLVHPDDVEQSRAGLAEVYAAPGVSKVADLRMQHSDGEWRHIELVCRNLLPTPGVEGVVINARDVTERHRAEQALRESEQLLLRAQKMDAIGRLAGGVAHDFNNLLTAIQGHADLLIGDLPDESTMGPDLREIRDAAQRATSLTRQLLAFSRRQVLQPTTIELNYVVSDMERMLRRVIGEHVILETRLHENAGYVRADRTQLEQVLLNLIVNARDAMPGGGTVIVETSSRDIGIQEASVTALQPGRAVVMRVTDTGTGMPPEVAARAFDPFFTTKPAGEGTGLGLSTVYGIVTQSGGHVWLDSSTGRGTQVTVVLPEAEPEAAEQDGAGDAQPATGPEKRPPSPHANGHETVLLVEDEKSVRDLAARILQRSGYHVLVAHDGRAALDLLERDRPSVDLLLTDVVMPGMSGPELATRVRARQPELPVLFISGYNEDAVLKDGVLVDGTAFLGKPFSPAVLLEKVREVLD